MAVNVQNYKKLTGKGTGEPKEYTVAEIADVYHPNLLVNGDFQINQRGQSVYDFGVVKYTLDMWIRQGSEIRVTSNGIIFNTVNNESNGVLGQKVESIEVGKKYTVCINIVSIKGSGSMSIGTRAEFDNVAHSNNLKQGINKITFTATGKWLTVCCKNVEINIDYIDLFEGDIAYPHVKKKYSEDLAECSDYLYPIAKGQYRTFGLGILEGNNISIFMDKKMNSVPSVLFNGKIVCFAIKGKNNVVSTVKSAIYEDRLILTLEGTNGIERGDTMLVQTNDVGSYIYLSCEPL